MKDLSWKNLEKKKPNFHIKINEFSAEREANLQNFETQNVGKEKFHDSGKKNVIRKKNKNPKTRETLFCNQSETEKEKKKE